MLLRSFFVFLLYKTPFVSFKQFSAMTTLIPIFGISILLELLYGTAAVALGIDINVFSCGPILVLFLRLFILLIYLIFRKVYLKKANDVPIRKVFNVLFFLSPLIYFGGALWLSVNNNSYFWIVLTFFIVITVIMVLVLIFEYASKKIEQEQTKLLSMQNELMNERLESDKRLMDAVHQTRHDLHKHLDYIHVLLDKDDTNEAQQYIQKISEPIKSQLPSVQTGCSAIDTVLLIEQRKAHAQGISMEIIAHGLQENCILPTDCNCILGNLLDNAIEAQADVENKIRYIQVLIQQKHDFLIMNIKNTVNKNPLLDNQTLQTSKKEQSHLHGIGLKSVNEAVKRYEGELSFDFKDELFEVSVILFIAK